MKVCDKRKNWSSNTRFYVSNKIYTQLFKLIFKLEQWQVEVESTGRKVKRLKSEAIFFGIFRFRKRK